MKYLSEWLMSFGSFRIRLLAWYFLLAVSTTGIAVWVTRQIYCDRLFEQADAALAEEVQRFQQTAEPLTTQQPTQQDVAALFDQIVDNHIPAEDESVLTFIDGQFYRASESLPDWLAQEPTLKATWASLAAPQQERLQGEHRNIAYAAEPLVIDHEVRGVFVAIEDQTIAYQSGTGAIGLVLKVSTAVLGVFFLIAWVTAGRLLRPLRLMNQTARQITEFDMTQRIPIQGSDEITAVTATFNDMLDRLQNAFDEQQEFLKDVSHELRTPITVIQGQLEILAYRPEKQAETITLITYELQQMNRLVNDLLLLAKAERPDFLILQPEDLDWLTEELYLKARSLNPDRDWRLEAKGLYPVTIDRQRFSQAVMNLLQNAVRHTRSGDVIALGSAVVGDEFRVWVRDAGEGIAPEDQTRIFERFTRATDNNRQFEGVGLGLSIVTAIVAAHGGRVELSSTLGKGSTFTLILPLEPPVLPFESLTHESHSYRGRQSAYR
ncbi:ATP-binding protein [Oscillatoria sp. CS-180]|uniref:sensor histidine kinase n=1 Tax=Oscillatoria sp. CS-180 TaxID=3021720 RepID=UPI0023307AEA|nr:ATP-binding protein [Oscillatoria sp. CS-180]MDB9526744.1 ATP-binding protein [Oscillatoria sp. CS-180]